VRTLFLVNPRSGARRNDDVSTLIRQTIKTPFDLQLCERKEDLDGMIGEAARDGFEVIYAVGGDGTVHEVAKRLIGGPLALGVLPTGSGNGFARHIGLPMEAGASLRACGQRRIVEIDTATVNGIPFLCTMGIGFDARIADCFAASSVRGFRTYARIGLREFFRYESQEYEVLIDGKPLRQRAFTVTVANASQYGNNARIAPNASVTDGLLDVVIIDEVSFFGACSLLPRLLRGTIDRSPHVTIINARHVEIRRLEGPAHLDGEPFALPALLTIDVNPGSLRVLLPDACGTI
jgi:YegS/Rv2252/BmrU family lipid kinase